MAEQSANSDTTEDTDAEINITVKELTITSDSSKEIDDGDDNA